MFVDNTTVLIRPFRPPHSPPALFVRLETPDACCVFVCSLLSLPPQNSLHEKCALSLHVSHQQQGVAGRDAAAGGMDASEVNV